MIRERTIGGRPVRAECAAAHDADRARQLESVLGVVADASGAGAPAEGTTIRFGWSAFRLTADGGGGALRVCEPDFARWPAERWLPTIDVTLETVSAQAALLRRLGVESEEAWLDQLVIVAPGALEAPDPFLRRTPATGPSDSGWLLATLADPEALTRGTGLAALPIATLAARRRALVQALALPTGFIALFAGDRLSEVLDGAGRPRLGG